MMVQFQAHGQFKSYVEGRLLISDVTGPWNKEMVEQCAAELHVLAMELAATGPHVGLAIVRESMLCPPDAFEALRRAIRYGATRLNCIGNAVVADRSVEGRTLLEGMYAKMYEGISPHRFFDDLDSAKAWSLALLAERGY